MDSSIVFFDFKPRGPSTGESNNVSLLKWPWLEQSLSVTDPQNIMLIRIYIYILIHILVYPNDPHIPSISPCIFRAFDGVFDPALAFSHPWWFSWEGSTWRSRCDLTSEK